MKKVLVSSLSILAISGAGWWYYASAANSPKPGAPKRPPVQVATAMVDAQSLSSSLSLVGNLDAVRSLEVASEITGKVERIAVKANQQVKKGDLLIEIDPVKAKAALLEAKAYYTDEQRKLEDYRKLIKRSAITQTELDAQQASVDIAKARMDVAQANYDDHFIRAPFSGVVGLIDFSEGKLVSAGETLFTLDDLSSMQLDVNVPEQHLGDLHPGLVVEAGNQAWPGDTFSGKLENVDTRVNSDSLNVRARILFANPEMKLKPGMMMTATLTFDPQTVPVIPVQAIEYSGTRRYVYVVGTEGIAKRTEVDLGARFDNQVQIDDGVTVGDRIVVQGLVNMRDGAKVKDLSTAKLDAKAPVEEGK